MGDSGVGKSSLVSRLTRGKDKDYVFDERHRETVGVEFDMCLVPLEGRPIPLRAELWDTGPSPLSFSVCACIPGGVHVRALLCIASRGVLTCTAACLLCDGVVCACLRFSGATAGVQGDDETVCHARFMLSCARVCARMRNIVLPSSRPALLRPPPPPRYLRGAQAALLVYDICRHATFENVRYWLEDLRASGFNSLFPILLVGNKSDLGHLRAVSTEEAQRFADENKIKFVETSAKANTEVKETFVRLLTGVWPWD